MTITTVALGLNTAVGFVVWQSELPTLMKVIITAILLGKFTLFFYSVWMSEGERMRAIGVTGCILLNVAIIVYAFLRHELLLVISTLVLLIFLLIWSVAVVYDFTPKTKQK